MPRIRAAAIPVDPDPELAPTRREPRWPAPGPCAAARCGRPGPGRPARTPGATTSSSGGSRPATPAPAPTSTTRRRSARCWVGWIKDEGWERPVTEARVFTDWPQLVGADIARRAVPVSLEQGELRITAETTAWATQLRLLSATLLARLVAELGPEIVTKLVITGPVGPSWKHGRLSVRGARGPRDTYG